MIRGPAPRLIADPIPAGIGALPIAITVRPPTRLDSDRPPAAPVGADNDPFTVRRERLIKIAFDVNLHRWQRHTHPDRYRRLSVGCVSWQRTAQHDSDHTDQAFGFIHGNSFRRFWRRLTFHFGKFFMVHT